MRMSETVAIIVTFNRKAMLLACLEAVAGQTAACDVLVVDNASTDGTADAVRPRLREGFSYVNTGANLGGAGGFAFGIAEALRRGYGRLWIMDDDVLPAPDALERLLEADGALGDEVGWLSSRCVLPSGATCPMNRQRSTPYAKIPDEALAGAEPVPAQMATFVSLFFRAESVRRFGLPIAEFFIWCDDLEWTRRVSRKRPCYVVPKSVVTHAITGSSASNVAVDVPARIPRYFYAFRNELFVYRREGLRGLAYYFAMTALNLARILFRARGHRLARFKALFSGLFAGLSFRPKPASPPVSAQSGPDAPATRCG
ncbi:MAG: glycosyltransferase [Kiritimatiellae bacterium]|nr:glycosyltransferase [Kiritimatiellia bacterium]